jgi:hypothetical protein
MFENLRKANLRRKYGTENAALILDVERAMEKLPSAAATKEWCGWVWSLPPEAWLEAVELKRRSLTVLAEREAVIRATTHKNKLKAVDPLSPEVADLERQVDEIKAREQQFLDSKRRFADRWGQIPN